MARLKEYKGHYCESEYEYAFIGFLESEGWKYSSGNNIHRVTKRDVLIADDFKKFIADTNPDLTEDEVTQIYDNVRLVGAESNFATLHKVYGWMVNGVQFTSQDGLPRMISLIDFDNWDKNIFSVGSNDEKDMYDYLGGVKNDKRSEELDAAFKQEKSNFSIVIVVDMWITGFDVPCLTYLYNDKPLKKHLLIQTISRVNRKYPGKEYGMVIDYIGIRDNMREAMKVYGGDTSVAPTSDDVEQATSVFREELEVLKNMFTGYDLSPFLNLECDPIERYRLLAKAAEYVFVSTEELQSEGNKGVQKVSFKTYFLKVLLQRTEDIGIRFLLHHCRKYYLGNRYSL